jgi:hypothetical protein
MAQTRATEEHVTLAVTTRNIRTAGRGVLFTVRYGVF